MRIGYRTDDQIRESALDFLRTYHPDDTLPVPIESIIEFDLGLDIFPFPDLQKNYGLVGALSQDFTLIYVDDYVFKNRMNLYRFTLAHEAGHYVMHRPDIENGEINTVDDWVNYVKEIASIGGWFETEAHIFASHTLIPAHHLETEFTRTLPEIELMVQTARENGIKRPTYLEAAIDAMAVRLSRVFQVSESAAKVRLSRDRFGERIP